MATKKKAKRLPRVTKTEVAEMIQETRRDELARAIEAVGSKSELARLLEVDVRTVRRWAEGTREIDGPAFVAMALIAIDPDVVLKMIREDVHPMY